MSLHKQLSETPQSKIQIKRLVTIPSHSRSLKVEVEKPSIKEILQNVAKIA